MARPVIGICTALERARWSVWDQHAYLLPRSYIDAVQRAGGLALMLPPDERAREAPDEVLDLLDGLILAGGADIDPAAYGETAHSETRGTVPERDDFEIALARRALERDLPLLGICRGMQVMAVAAGGVLEQHVPDRVGHVDHSPGTAIYGEHVIETVGGTRLAELLGPKAWVPSYHHQSVRTHPGFEPAAWAPDGTLEAMEDPDSAFRVGVQWHPEVGDDPRLFDALVRAASRR
jgi:putative glutamine amidotransferase